MVIRKRKDYYLYKIFSVTALCYEKSAKLPNGFNVDACPNLYTTTKVPFLDGLEKNEVSICFCISFFGLPGGKMAPNALRDFTLL
jgi:hypothetical protein